MLPRGHQSPLAGLVTERVCVFVGIRCVCVLCVCVNECRCVSPWVSSSPCYYGAPECGASIDVFVGLWINHMCVGVLVCVRVCV